MYNEIKNVYGITIIASKTKGGGRTMYWLTGIAGAILVVSPYIFSYIDNQAAVWTSLLLGFVVLMASIWEGMESRKENWEYWVAGLVGITAIFAPFILGFGRYTSEMWTYVIVGGVIVLLAGSTLWRSGVSEI